MVVENSTAMDPKDIQEKQYGIPYHYLPWDEGGAWHVGRFLGWGFEYLAVLYTVLELIKESCQGISDGIMLDFGCGDGRLISEVLAMNLPLRALVGVDISKRALCFARAATWGHRNVKFFTTIEQAVQAMGVFDIVVAMEVLEHIPPEDLPSIIDHLYRATTGGGWLIVSVPTQNVPPNRKHYQHFTLETLSKAIEGKFVVGEALYVHRLGFWSEFIRRMVINRIFVANSRKWLRFCSQLYNRFVRIADEKTGAHLICSFQKSL